MPQKFDFIFRNGIIVNNERSGRADVGVLNGKISKIGNLSQNDAKKTIDCNGLHIIPGVIDTQVHFREPGFEYKETLETGSRAAVLGGVTSVFEMPNTHPPTTTEVDLQDKLAKAKNRMYCDYAFWVGATHDNLQVINDLENLPGSAGIKVFLGSSTGPLLLEDTLDLVQLFKKIQRRAAFHAEDESRLRARKYLQEEGNVASHAVWRDEEAAFLATKKLVEFANTYEKKIHILHVSTKKEILYLKNNKHFVSCEVTPHHLTLTSDDYARLGALIQMNPPIRGPEHRGKLWWALKQGIVDVLGSDHAPHTLEEKAKNYPNTPSGITGVQTLLPIMLNHVNAGRLRLERLVQLTSYNPCQIFKIKEKGRIAIGNDADLTIIDLKKRSTIRNEQSGSRSGWTPYEGVNVQGWPIGTVIRGHVVMWDGEIIGKASGKPILFEK